MARVVSLSQAPVALAVALAITCLSGCSGGAADADASDGQVADAATADAAGPPDARPIASTYAVLTDLSESDPYYEAVEILAAHRAAEVIEFDPGELEALKDTLIDHGVRYAAIVLHPDELDANFARSFLMMSTELDDDPFADFAYGYITGATAADAVAFVEGIIDAELGGIADAPLTISGYAASNLNFVFTGESSYLSYLEPESSTNIALETGNPDSLPFFVDNAHYLSGVKLLDIGHNGDPHMLWLFEGGNSVPDIWSYDPALVENPPVERLGLTSDDIRTLDLSPAVAFNGACHSGVPKRAVVESDIMATFGDTGGVVRFYDMSDDFSFALSILRTGITGYFAPIGANNANDQAEDIYLAMRYSEPLGDIHKRAVDAVVMGFLGNRPALRLFQDGASTYDYETLPSGSYDPADFGLASSAMLSGKANRIYFGDPLYNPFSAHYTDAIRLVHTEIDPVDTSTLDVDLIFEKPEVYFPIWDKFHDGGARVYTTVELPATFAAGVEVTPLGASGNYTRVIHALEQHDGRTLLHIEVAIPDDSYGLGAIDFTMTLRVTAAG